MRHIIARVIQIGLWLCRLDSVNKGWFGSVCTIIAKAFPHISH